MAAALVDEDSKQPAVEERNQGPAEMGDDPQASLSDSASSSPGEIGPPFLELPPELVQLILSYLSAPDLARLSAACCTLAEHATNELLWMNIVNSHLPEPIHDPGVFDSFRTLYIAHHPCWFVPRNKVWFSDIEHTGNLILARYDHRRGVIEAYRVIAERRSHQFQLWDLNPDVIVQSFNPKVRLWLDDPVLLLKNRHGARPQYLRGETRMAMPVESQNIFNAFSLCSTSLPADLKANQEWPPSNIPSKHRVCRAVEHELPERDLQPQQLDNVSQHAFRIKRWAHFQTGMPIFTAGRSETLSTYATLDPDLYTPTKEKPYQGIWVGDYSAHGCEFLLFLQRERVDEHASPENSSDSDEESIPQCGLEAIKLTGDPNVPRGEISFSADDIGSGGLIRIAEEALFQGARIVRSRGHVAGLGFRDDTFIASQLILISTECVAHYWETMGHISYYRRLDIDALLRT